MIMLMFVLIGCNNYNNMTNEDNKETIDTIKIKFIDSPIKYKDNKRPYIEKILA